MTNHDKELDDLLNFDALAEAEKIRGTSYKEDNATSMLGLALQFDKVQSLRAALDARDDTKLSETVSNYLRIAQSEGFEIVLQLPFTGRWRGGVERQETLYVLFNAKEGILLKFDTYNSKDVNGGKFYYNWRPNPGVETWRVTSSGGWHGTGEDSYWVGDHDCREALRHHLAKLRQNGAFLTPWRDMPFLWLLHYMDTKDAEGGSLLYNGYDYKAITAERIAMLPDFVQVAIGAKSGESEAAA